MMFRLTSPRIRASAVLVVIAGVLSPHQATIDAQPPNPDPQRFEKDIAAFEAEDRASPPAAGSTLFVGSSSIRYWDVAKAFPGTKTIKRGFGGSHVSDNIHFADRIIFAYKPALIVFYAGDADVAANKNADQIFADYKTLIGLIHARLPQTPVIVIGTKPSPAHWKQIETIRRANTLVKEYVANDPLVAYADVDQPLLGPDGRPRPDFYVENGLNLSEQGYTAWTAAVRPVIERPWPKIP
jgi:lysophospholipase L1-like esterase